ncbi:hypothetical protein PTSG_12966 [Salpingoeca rosetta]|uniref:S1 motif domain-containing protein n=1 Tax=Salpingoeca rosetta (strain ATCC 50818 / BSB-021) TaxID=946362 RepID=F2UNM2_SALR5|nr:uncharacterized protein PTSG_12966 [Salpingoeca rosetta]EGD79227.1 hypothetical protein PTSG_12966 [Salpingoeca rosetta]|eukprot:XP_004989312.1 hypothetical protein PTSG_12966 [Salpingoeca rosetta]
MSAIIPDEPSFPRGGAQALSALERRQIREQAKKDVEKELSAGADISALGRKPITIPKGKDTDKKKKKQADASKKKKTTKAAAKTQANDTPPPVASPISFKRLKETASVVGVVHELQDFKAKIALGNGLFGMLHLSDVSPYYTDFLKSKAMEEDESDSDSDSDDDDDEDKKDKKEEVVTFRRLFSVGQQIVCRVKSTELKNNRPIINLTVNPTAINKGLETAALVKGRVVAACVKSIEEHGYVLDLGVGHATGFLSTNNAKPLCEKLGTKSLVPGHPLLVALTTTVKGGRAAKVIAAPSEVAATKLTDEEVTLKQLRAGLLVDAKVKAHTRSGLIASALGFDANVHYYHLPHVSGGDVQKRLKTAYPEGSVVPARIIFSNPAASSLNLSLLPAHISMRGSAAGTGATLGAIVETATVLRTDGRGGAVLDLGAAGQGFVAPSRVSDKKSDASLKKLKPGSVHRARIISVHPMDNIVAVSLQKSVLDLPYYRYEDIPAGAVVEATVESLEEYGALVRLSDTIRGLVPALHFADVTLRKPAVKFHPGAKVKCRVLSNIVTSKGKRRLAFTCKKTLVESDLPVIASAASARRGMLAHGFIDSIRPFGCIVRFYNNVKGLVPLKELSATEKIKDASAYFKEGQVVKCRVVQTDQAKRRIGLSFIHTALSEDDINKQRDTVTALSPGSIVTAVIDSVQTSGLNVHLKENPLVRVTIDSMHLTDHPSLAPQMASCFTEGQKITAVVIWKRNRNVSLSLKPSLMVQAKEAVVASKDELKEGEQHFGYISSSTRTMSFVNLIGSVSGMCPIREASSGYVRSMESYFSPNQTVCARVHAIKDGKVDFSFKSAQLSPQQEASFIQSYFADLERIAVSSRSDVLKYKAGDVVSAVVKDIKDYGITVVTDDGCTGFISSAQAKGVPLETDGKVEAVVLDVDTAKSVLDLGVRPSLVAGAKKVLGGAGEKKKSKKKGKKGKKGKQQQDDEDDEDKPVEKLSQEQEADATIELVKEDYMVLSVGDGRLVVAACKSYNDRESPFRKHFPGNGARVKVLALDEKHTFVQVLAEDNKGKGKDAKKQAKKADADKKQVAALSPASDATMGAIIKAKISAIHKAQLNLKLAGGGRGRVHITEVEQPQEDGAKSFDPFTKNQVVECRVIGYRDAKNHNFLPITHTNFTSTIVEASMRAQDLSKSKKKVVPRLTADQVQVGQKLLGVVGAVEPNRMWIDISIHLSGRVSLQNAQPLNGDMLKSLQDMYEPGSPITTWVVAVKNGKVELSTIDPATQEEQENKEITTGRVHTKGSIHLIVRLGRGKKGRVHICDVDDKFHADPFQRFALHELVKVKKVEAPKHSHRNEQQHKADCQLSMRPSEIDTSTAAPRDPIIASAADVKQDQIVRGYVCNVTDNGVFVALSRHVSARVKIANLSDLFIKDFTKVFKPGQLVKGKVLFVTDDGKIELTLKRSAVNPRESKPVRYNDLKIGQIVAGVIKRVESFGVFVTIDNSKLSGLAHISECADAKIDNLDAVYNVGDAVKAKILRLNKEKKRISLTLKPSAVEGKQSTGEDDEESGEPKAKKAKRAKKAEKKQAEEDKADNSGDKTEEEQGAPAGDDDDDDEEYLDTTKVADKSKRLVVLQPTQMAEESDEEEEDDDEDFVGRSEGGYTDASDAAKAAAMAKKAQPLAVEGDSVWADDVDGTIDSLLFGDANDDDDDEEDDDELQDGPLSKRAKHAAKKQREAETRRKEEEKVAGKKEPQTPMDFDRLVLQAPNSSYAWIRYMAYYLKLTELDKARAVGKRALSTINFREEKERMNVWVALLNLENAYGTPATLNNVFTEACRQMDPQRMYFHLVSIYERSHKFREADELFQVMCKKFNKVQRVWLRFAEFKFKRGRSKEARQVLERSLKSLPRPDHVDTIVKFGILEFKQGDVERARTIFENVLSNYPKRVDLWSIYLDQEQRVGDKGVIRALFERVITLNLSSKKMRFFFKRYLDFEKEHGDAGHVEHVKEKAREYVASKSA